MGPIPSEIAHQMGLIPLTGIIVLVCSGRRPPILYLWVAFGFAISWPADSQMFFKNGSAEVWYYFVPFQIWVIASGFMRSRADRIVSFLAFPALAVVSWELTAPEVEQVVTIAGSIVILILAKKAGGIFAPLLIYFGAGTVAYIYMANSPEHAMAAPMWAYQSLRLIAYIAFTVIIAPPLIRQKKRGVP